MQPQDTTSPQTVTTSSKPARKWDDPEYRKAYFAAYRLAHHEKCIANQKAYRETHLEEVRALDRARDALRREYVRNYSREYARTHAVENRARVKAWQEANLERAKLSWRKSVDRRRARLAAVVFQDVDRNAIIARDKGICGICGRKVPAKQITLDHILPLSQGGAHAPYNLQVAHRSCNSRKFTGRLPSQLRLNV